MPCPPLKTCVKDTTDWTGEKFADIDASGAENITEEVADEANWMYKWPVFADTYASDAPEIITKEVANVKVAVADASGTSEIITKEGVDVTCSTGATFSDVGGEAKHITKEGAGVFGSTDVAVGTEAKHDVFQQQTDVFGSTDVDVGTEAKLTKERSLVSFQHTRSFTQDGTNWMWQWRHLKNMSALASIIYGGGAPSYEYVCSWWASAKNNQDKTALFLVTLTVNWVISAVLAVCGVACAHIYRNLINWGSTVVDLETTLVFTLIGGIFSGWNIAQYASYTIQTHGHFTLRQHLYSLWWFLPWLLPCNLVGWAAALIVTNTAAKSWPVFLQLLIVAAAPIAMGIWVKTRCKLNYFLQFSCHNVPAGGGLQQKIAAQSVVQCPFSRITQSLVLKNAIGPYTCFLWTVVYVIALRLGYVGATLVQEPARSIIQILLFAVSCAAVWIGNVLLNNWIKNSHGYFEYSGQMMVAFFVIYNMVSDIQVRLGVVQFDDAMRFVCATLQPAMFTILRFLSVRAWKNEKKLRTDKFAGKHESRLVLFTMSTIVTQNVSCVLVAALPCMFNGVNQLQMGKCERNVLLQIAYDSLVTWAFDIVAVAAYVHLGLPVIYFFSLLDPFLILAALIVVCLNVLLAVLAATVS